MYDLSFFRANLDAIAARLATRGLVLDLAQFRDLDSRRRAALTESEQLKAQRNSASQEVGKLKKQGVDTSAQQQQVRENLLFHIPLLLQVLPYSEMASWYIL